MRVKLPPFGLQAFVGLLVGLIVVSSPSAVEKPNSLIVCLPSYIDSFDPTDHRSRLTQLTLKNIYESLTARGDDLETIPELARSWEQLDLFTWEFKLKEGVLFHNGDELTSEDVRFTFDRVCQPGGLEEGRTSPRGELFQSIEGVEVVDRYTVRFHTRRPWAVLPKMLSLQEILPQKYMKAVGPGGLARRPVGTGPFRVEAYREGLRIELSRFAEHRDYAGLSAQEKSVRVGHLVFMVEPRGIDQIADLKRGRADLILNIPPSAVTILAASPEINIVSMSPTRSHFAEINCRQPPLNDPRVRQALNLAVDRKAVLASLLLGRGQALPTVLQPSCFGYNQDLAPYPHDPAKARKLLAAAGYPPDRPLLIHSHVSNLDLANALALFFTKVGLKATVQATQDYRPTSLGPQAPWDLFVGSWGNSTMDPVDIIPPKFRSDGTANFSGYANKTLDHLIVEAEEMTDMAIRAGYYHRIQEIIHQDAPMVFGFAADEIYAFRGKVLGFKPSPTGFLRLEKVRLAPGG
ncbi:MAG: ABC transporter substrate-binding protein [Thermodesulfobacteriota bacterium]